MRRPSILVADEAWVALARLHREHPDRTAFTSSEIVQTIKAEHAHPDFRAGIYPHINTHNVANLPPNSARYRMFYRLPNATYRLFRQGDDYHSHRTGKTHPQRRQLPEVYHHLLDWYEREYSSAANAGASLADPLLSLSGVGREIWTGVDADEYVNRLREAWFKDEEARVPSRSGPDI